MLRKNEKDRNSCQMKIFYQICLAGSLCREEAKLYELKRKDLVYRTSGQEYFGF